MRYYEPCPTVKLAFFTPRLADFVVVTYRDKAAQKLTRELAARWSTFVVALGYRPVYDELLHSNLKIWSLQQVDMALGVFEENDAVT